MSHLIGDVEFKSWAKCKVFLDATSPLISYHEHQGDLSICAIKDGVRFVYYTSNETEKTAFDPYKETGAFDLG